MLRITVLLWLFVACVSLAQSNALEAPTLSDLNADKTIIVARIKTASQRVEQMEANWEQSKSEIARDLMQQQVSADMQQLVKQIDRFLDQAYKIPDAKSLAVAVIRAENHFLEARLDSASTYLGKLFEQYELVDTRQQLLILFSIDDLYDYINWLLAEQQENLQQLQTLGIDTDVVRQTLNHKITAYSEFMAAYLRTNARQRELLEDELESLPADARNTLIKSIASQNRLVKSAVNNLKHIVVLMEEQRLPVAKYNELIFKTTGNLAEAVVNLRTLRTIVIGLSEDALIWFTTNLGSIASLLLLFVLLMAGTILLSRLVRQIIFQAVTHKKTKLSTLVQEFFVAAGGNLVLFFGFLFALAQIGLDLAPLLTGLGVAGIVVGFALQDTLSNFAAGIMILIYRPFDVGDFVEAGGVSGKVGKMNLVNTTIRTFDNQVFMVPNAKIWGETIKNITSERIRRVDMVFAVAYRDDIEQVEGVLAEVVSSHPKVLKTPKHTIRLHLLNSSSVDFIVRPWVKTADYWDVYWDITREIKLRFDKEGITIPFPQQDIHLHQNERSENSHNSEAVRE